MNDRYVRRAVEVRVKFLALLGIVTLAAGLFWHPTHTFDVTADHPVHVTRSCAAP